MRTPIQTSVENGDSTLKVLSSDSALLRKTKLIPVWIKGVVMSTTCSLAAVMVSGATAKSASCFEVQQNPVQIYRTYKTQILN